MKSPQQISFSRIRFHDTYKLTLRGLIALIALLPTSPALSKQKPPPRTMAHSMVSPDFKRERLPNGQWENLSYALAIGQRLDPSERDESLSQLSYQEMAEILSEPLHRQGYIPETDPDQTDLMIVVNWGKTFPYHNGLKQLSLDGMSNAMNQIEIDSGGSITTGSDAHIAELETLMAMQSMAERARKQANDYNARLLGFAPELDDLYQTDPMGGPQRLLLDELESEIEAERYFVILQAYDFKSLVAGEAKNLLWVTRFSIRARGRQFDEELANMAQAASSLFGAESKRLRRNLYPGHISMGEVEVIDVVEDDEIDEP